MANTENQENLQIKVKNNKQQIDTTAKNQENLQVKVEDNKKQIDAIVKSQENLQTKIDAIVDKIYPIGSIYMSVNATSPSALFGGTWVKIEGRFLLGSGGSYSLGATGGEAQHTLTIGEMPSHNHTFNDYFYGYPKIDYRINLDSFYTPLYDKIHPSKIPDDNAYTKDSGGSQAHNNMPPYLTVNIWKRTA